MQIKMSDIENYSFEKHHLQKLDVWLSYEIGSSGLLIAHFILPFVLVFIMIVVAALIFMPIMLFTLYQLRKFGWLTLFVVIVTPPLFIDLIFVQNNVFEWTLRGFSLASFYFYCFTLKYYVRDRLSDLSSISPKISNSESYFKGF
jgi:hypothetical protein